MVRILSNSLKDKKFLVLLRIVSVFCLVGLLSSCKNTAVGNSLKDSLAPDPQLKATPAVLGNSTPTPGVTSSPTQLIKLPSDFPAEIPLYPNAELQEVTPAENATDSVTRLLWKSSDPNNIIQGFYQKAFETQKWEMISGPSGDSEGTLSATQNQLKVSLSFPSAKSSGATTEFMMEYSRGKIQAIKPSPSISLSPSSSPSPLTSSSPSPSPSNTTIAPNSNEIPPELRQAVTEVTQLGILKIKSGVNLETVTSLPDPNKMTTRRDYARWLMEANNKIYDSRAAKKIRLGVATSAPAFTDISPNDPDFPAIQGLAESGIIPSSLSGDGKDVKFRPDDALTREQMLLWKVPLDTRQALPTANIDAVKEKWGFQDSSKIDTFASRALLADYNNGDLANVRRVYGFTTLFQPKKPVTRAEAVASLWYFGTQGEGLSAKDVLQPKTPTN
jgi:S-layer homology domain